MSMDIEKHRRKSRIYNQNFAIRVNPDLKQRIENLKPYLEINDILREAILATVEECEAKLESKGA